MSRSDYLNRQVAHLRQSRDCAMAVINFMLDLDPDDAMSFLNTWNVGEFDMCRKEWPEAPEACYIGADVLHPETLREPEA